MNFLEFKISNWMYYDDCDAAVCRRYVSHVWSWAVVSLQEAVRIENLLEGYEMELEQGNKQGKGPGRRESERTSEGPKVLWSDREC